MFTTSQTLRIEGFNKIFIVIIRFVRDYIIGIIKTTGINRCYTICLKSLHFIFISGLNGININRFIAALIKGKAGRAIHPERIVTHFLAVAYFTIFVKTTYRFICNLNIDYLSIIGLLQVLIILKPTPIKCIETGQCIFIDCHGIR